MSDRRDSAIWIPVISTRVMRSILYLMTALLAVLTFTLPESWSGFGIDAVNYIASSIADVRYMTSQSLFPFVTATTYSLAAIGAFWIALATCFTDLKLSALYSVTAKRSTFSRVVWFLGALTIVLAPYFLELKVSNTQMSSKFFIEIGRNRFFLIFWIEGSFLGFYVSWLWVLFEATNFANTVLGRTSRD